LPSFSKTDIGSFDPRPKKEARHFDDSLVLVVGENALLSLCLRRKKNPKIMRLRTATPPMTPPTITPVLLGPALVAAVLFVLEGVDAAGAVVAAELLAEPPDVGVLG
jgi:hypothetical protein